MKSNHLNLIESKELELQLEATKRADEILNHYDKRFHLIMFVFLLATIIISILTSKYILLIIGLILGIFLIILYYLYNLFLKFHLAKKLGVKQYCWNLKRKVHQEINCSLQTREPLSNINYCNIYSQRQIEIFEDISKIFIENMGLNPQSTIYPEDKISLISLGSYDDMDIVDAICYIERRYKIKFEDEFIQNQELSFGELVRFIDTNSTFPI